MHTLFAARDKDVGVVPLGSWVNVDPASSHQGGVLERYSHSPRAHGRTRCRR